jgi:molecular chaperone DnaK (HSP70)
VLSVVCAALVQVNHHVSDALERNTVDCKHSCKLSSTCAAKLRDVCIHAFQYDQQLHLRFYDILLALTAAIHYSRIPAVQALAAGVFKQQPVVSDASEELVVLGACLAARRDAFGS